MLAGLDEAELRIKAPGGVVDLVDVHQAVGEYAVCCASPWGEPHVWHLEMANPRPLPTPIPARGISDLASPAASRGRFRANCGYST